MGETAIKKLNRKGALLNKYSGKWVAFDENNKIVTWAETLEELDRKIEKMKLKKKVSYFLVPRKDEGPYILIFLK